MTLLDFLTWSLSGGFWRFIGAFMLVTVIADAVVKLLAVLLSSLTRSKAE